MRISYLDGLRGFAALIVVVGHIYGTFFGYYSTEKLSNPLRLFYDAALSVEVFFVLSGFVLSYKYLKHRSSSYLRKLVIKRIPRLGIPIFFTLLLIAILYWCGLFYHVKLGEPFIQRLGVYNPGGLYELIQCSFLKVFIASNTNFPLELLWTMYYEFWGSLLIVLMCFLIYELRFNILLYILFLLFSFTYSYHFGCFVFGFGLAFFYINYHSYFAKKYMIYAVSIALILFIIAYISIPRTHYLISFYACYIVMSMLFVPQLQTFFSTRALLFLGKISFPLYLVHMIIIASPVSFMALRHKKHFDEVWFQISICLMAIILSVILAAAFYIFERLGIKAGAAVANLLVNEPDSNINKI